MRDRLQLGLFLLAACRPAVASDAPPVVAGGWAGLSDMAGSFDSAPTAAAVVAAVERAMAPPAPPAPPPPCPPEMAQLGRFCIDRYEGHLVTLGPTGELVVHPHTTRPPAGEYFAARSAAGVMPQGYISRDEATLACHNAGKRLCSWLEWRRACQGPSWRRYPYAGGARRGVCNVGKDHLLHRFFEGERLTYDEHFNSPRLNAEPGFLAAAGAHAECVSPEGVADLVGNLHEWVSTTVTDDFVERMEAEPVERIDQPWRVGNGMFLGGFFSTVDQHGPGCFYTTIAHEPSYHDYSTGFRCCSDARREPTNKPGATKKSAATKKPGATKTPRAAKDVPQGG